MNKERRVGRRSVIRNLVKVAPDYNDEEKDSKGPKKALFNDDTTFVMKRSLKPLPEINNFQYSSSKSKSHEKLYEENTYDIPKSKYMNMFAKHNIIPLSPPSRIRLLERRNKPIEPVVQSKELYNTLIDSPCTRIEKLQYQNALSSASKYLLYRHLESVEKNADMFKVTTPEPILSYENNFKEFKTPHLKDLNISSKQDIYKSDYQTQTSNIPLSVEEIEEMEKSKINDICQSKLQCDLIITKSTENKFNEFKTPYFKDLNIVPKQDSLKPDPTDCQTQTSNISLSVEEIEEMEKSVINDIRQSKLQCSELIKNRFREIELEIEKHFDIMEKKVTENYDKMLKKVKDENNESSESQSTDITVKEKNYTRMTGAFGILNNLNKDCSFLKTPTTKGKTREEMLNKGILTPGTMSFVLQEQLMHLNSSS